MAVTPTTHSTNSLSCKGATAMIARVAATFPTAWVLMVARVPVNAKAVISMQMMFPVKHQFNAANKLRNHGTRPEVAAISKLMDKEILPICHRSWKSTASVTKRHEKLPKAFLGQESHPLKSPKNPAVNYGKSP